MAKFDGYLFCTDLDDTLLTTDKRISKENLEAIKFFTDNGGLFTFATGRVPLGASLMLKYFTPNAPIVCFNGGAIYDFASKKFLWRAKMGSRAQEAVDFVAKAFPSVGIEVCTADSVYFCKVTRRTEIHKQHEKFPDNYADSHSIQEPWQKVIFMVEEDEIDTIRKIIAESEFADEFSYVRSSPWYYELLPKGANKGSGMLRLAKMLNIDPKKTIGMGDNENDVTLVLNAGLGVAVANAAESVKNAADMVTVDNNSHAARAVIEELFKAL